MNKSSFGTALTISLFGESHGPIVGAVISGFAPGIKLDISAITAEMDRRRAYSPVHTARQESDNIEFAAGLYQGRTTGSPLMLFIRNQNVQSTSYANTAQLPRPGHADYASIVKSYGHADLRGGGHLSGRLTAPLVAAGAICKQILAQHGITLGAHIARCGGVSDIPLPQEPAELALALHTLTQKPFATLSDDAATEMQAAILAAKDAGDSVGGVLEGAVCGLTAGVGEPFFASVESVLSALFFAIPGVKGVSFGSGFAFADMRGSEAGDAFAIQDGAVRTKTNHNGGINGGITNGMPIVYRLAVKPTPSIATPQTSVNLQTGLPQQLSSKGRHDPCILPRIPAVAEAVCAFAMVDLCTQRYGTAWQNAEIAP